MEKSDLIRIFMPGGVLSPRDLAGILEVAGNLGNEIIHFGSRQDILFPGNGIGREELGEEFDSIRMNYEWKDKHYQNIVTSYVAVNIMPTTPWVTTGTYYNVLEHVDCRPRLKINITDPKQSLVPLFNGQLNFVASGYEDYWFLFLKFKHSDTLKKWPVLIYSLDIGKIVAAIEQYYLNPDKENNVPADTLFREINERMETNNRTISEEPELSAEPFPYYEGLNKMVSNKYWLGLYWRNNNYTISFLKKVCELCRRTNSGKIIITPWKSFIIKDIAEEDRPKWEFLCGINGINLRHSSLELNWHLPVLNERALKLKNYLADVFDKHDISTYGLTFSVKERPVNLFTSIAIMMHPSIRLFGKYDLQRRYNVLYSKDFNPNEQNYSPFAMNVTQKELPHVLMELSRIFYARINKKTADKAWEGSEDKREKQQKYQCSRCMTVYDERYGDPEAGIPEGVPFPTLPDSYSCPLCNTPKSEFKEIEIKLTEEAIEQLDI